MSRAHADGVLSLLMAQTRVPVFDLLLPEKNADGSAFVAPSRYVVVGAGMPDYEASRLAGLQRAESAAIVTHAVGGDRVQAAWADEIVVAQLLNRVPFAGADALEAVSVEGPLVDESVVPHRVYFRRVWESVRD